MRSERVLEKTCLRYTIKRLMREKKLELKTVSEATGIPYTTLFDWTTGVIPSNPDQLYNLSRYFKVTADYLFYGTDEDREELRRRNEELERKLQQLEMENADQRAQLSIFEEIKRQEKQKTNEVKTQEEL